MSRWERVEAAEAFSILMGRQRSPARATGPHMTPYLRSANVGDGRLDLSDVKEMDFDPAERERFRLQVGDVLVSEGSASAAAVGMASVWNAEIEGPVCFQNTLLRFRAVEGRTLPGFVLQWCRWAFQSGAFLDAASGTNIKHIGSSRAARMPVALPPLDEQRRIVDVMAVMDAKIEAQALELEDLVRLREPLTGKILRGLGGATVALGDVLEIVRGGSPRPIDDFITDDANGLNWIKIGDVAEGGKYVTQTAQKIRPEGLSKTRFVSAGSFILSNSMSFGRPYILRVDGCIHDGWLALNDTGGAFDQDFLYYLLRGRGVQDQFRRLAAGSGVKNLNIKSVQGVKVCLPDREAQAEAVDRLNLLTEAEEALALELESLRAFRSTLLSALLSQEIEIPESYDKVLSTLRG